MSFQTLHFKCRTCSTFCNGLSISKGYISFVIGFGVTFKTFERSHLSLLLKKIRLYLSQCSVRQSRNLLWASYPDGDQSFLSRGRKCNASAWKDFFIVMQKQDFPAEQTFSFWRKTHQYFRVLGTEKFLTIRPNSIDYFFSKEARIELVCAWFPRCNWNLSHFGTKSRLCNIEFWISKGSKVPFEIGLLLLWQKAESERRNDDVIMMVMCNHIWRLKHSLTSAFL